eukprot:m51a1_g14223 hypothetical protein (187) ;mRNA; f:192163-192844
MQAPAERLRRALDAIAREAAATACEDDLAEAATAAEAVAAALRVKRVASASTYPCRTPILDQAHPPAFIVSPSQWLSTTAAREPGRIQSPGPQQFESWPKTAAAAGVAGAARLPPLPATAMSDPTAAAAAAFPDTVAFSPRRHPSRRVVTQESAEAEQFFERLQYHASAGGGLTTVRDTRASRRVK